MKRLVGKERRYFIDGYDVSFIEKGDESNIMLRLLSDINTICFDGIGYIKTVTFFDEQNLVNNGIGGMILSQDMHFVCRFLNQRWILLVDFFTLRKTARIEKVMASLKKHFGCSRLESCMDGKYVDYGTNLIVEIPQITSEKAKLLLNQVCSAIEKESPVEYPMSRTDPARFALLQVGRTSYAAIHLYEKTKVVLDIFSFWSFSAEEVLKILDTAQVPHISWHIVDRGSSLIKEAF